MSRHRIGEPGVYRAILLPAFDLEREHAGRIVEQRPEDAVGEVTVVGLHLVAREVDGHRSQGRQLALEVGTVGGPRTVTDTWPSDPPAIASLVQLSQTRHQTA